MNWEELERRYAARRDHRPGIHVPAGSGFIETALSLVRKSNRDMGQVCAFIQENAPDLVRHIAGVSLIRGTLTIECADQSSRFLIDRWIRCNHDGLIRACSRPPRRITTSTPRRGYR